MLLYVFKEAVQVYDTVVVFFLELIGLALFILYTESFRIVEDTAKLTTAVAADLYSVTKARFQVLCRNVVKLVELLGSTSPHLVFLKSRVAVGLIPNFPVFDSVVEAVCPALVVVADYVLTNARPLCRVLWGIDVIGLYMRLILNSNTEAENRLYVVRIHLLYKLVCKREIIGRRVFNVGIKISENIGNINKTIASERSVNVVETRIRYFCVSKMSHVREIEFKETTCKGRLSNCMHRLYFAELFACVDLNCSHLFYLFFVFCFFKIPKGEPDY